MNKTRLFFNYLSYLIRAKNEHHIHSPFLFNLYTKVISSQEQYACFEVIEQIRRELLNNSDTIEANDLGAGSAVFKTNRRKINDIARISLKSKKFAQLLFRLVNHFQPKNSLELGTSLGITTLYLASANKQGSVLTVEGSEVIAAIANQNFKKMSMNNINSVCGNFDDVLLNELGKIKEVDFVFFDGNHQKSATLNYFEQCLKFSNNNSLFVFDDIHWSVEMEQAWEIIKEHPQVKLTVDLFFVGLVFFRKEQQKEHFILRI